MSLAGRQLSYWPQSEDCKTFGTVETARTAGRASHRAEGWAPRGLKGTVHGTQSRTGSVKLDGRQVRHCCCHPGPS
jgi:hypothetical protein